MLWRKCRIYLRADYSIQCYTPSWYAFAAYSLSFLVFYVICFPLFIGSTLWSYRRQLAAQMQGPYQVCKLAPEGLMLGFLLDHYKLQLPCFMWESEEMVPPGFEIGALSHYGLLAQHLYPRAATPAQVIWGNVFRGQFGRNFVNPHVQGIPKPSFWGVWFQEPRSGTFSIWRS